jgi:hypothetical protein
MPPGYLTHKWIAVLDIRREGDSLLDRACASDREDIGTPHDITWSHYPAILTTIESKEEQGLAPVFDSRPTCALYSKHANLRAIVAFTPGRVILL